MTFMADAAVVNSTGFRGAQTSMPGSDPIHSLYDWRCIIPESSRYVLDNKLYFGMESFSRRPKSASMLTCTACGQTDVGRMIDCRNLYSTSRIAVHWLATSRQSIDRYQIRIERLMHQASSVITVQHRLFSPWPILQANQQKKKRPSHAGPQCGVSLHYVSRVHAVPIVHVSPRGHHKRVPRE